MIIESVLVICISVGGQDTIFAKLVGYQIGNCQETGSRIVNNISPSFNGVRYICKPRTAKDTINGLDYNECGKRK